MELQRTDDFLGQGGGLVTLALGSEKGGKLSAQFIPAVIDVIGIGGFDVAYYAEGKPHGYVRKAFFPWSAVEAVEDSEEVTA